MARGMNHVYLVGALARDPELRYTPNGTAVFEATVAGEDRVVVQAGVVHEDRRSAELRLDTGYGIRHRRGVCDVRADRECPAAGIRDRRDRVCAVRFVEVEHGDGVAVRGQTLRCGGADAACGAGDESDFSLNASHWSSSRIASVSCCFDVVVGSDAQVVVAGVLRCCGHR